MMAAIETFDDARQLSEAELRELVRPVQLRRLERHDAAPS